MGTVPEIFSNLDRSSHKKDYVKCIRELANKFAQVIVQSRQGLKVKTPSKVTNSEFHLNIVDCPEVTIQTNHALGEGYPSQQPVCVDIFLETPEGEKMVLECWWMRVADPIESLDSAIPHEIYSSMSNLLKSLICVARTTPAYRLSFRQGLESYIMCYYIYVGNPDLPALGIGPHQNKVGHVITPVGTVYMAYSFRTKLTMTPSSQNEEHEIMVKSDYFDTEYSPLRGRKNVSGRLIQGRRLSESPLDFHSPMSGVPVASFSDKSGYEESDDDRSEKQQSSDINPDEDSSSLDDRPRGGLFPMDLSKEFPDKEVIADIPFSALFNSRKTKFEQPPAHSLISEKQIESTSNASISSKGAQDQMAVSVGSEISTDDFVMVDFKPPFAGYEEACGNEDVNYFFRECQTAPATLPSLPSENSFSHVAELTTQLKQFEISLLDFDEFEKELISTE